MVPIIDAHHHIWRQEDLPWLKGPMVPRIFGPYEPLRRDYPVTEFLEDLEGNDVEASVYIQVNWGKGQELEEVRWVSEVNKEHGWPHAIVSYVDLLSDTAPEMISVQSEYPLMRGVRMQLHWHEDERYRFQPEPDVMNKPIFRENFKHLADQGWSFDLQLFAGQMKDGAELVAAFPDTTFILQHVGMLEDGSPTNREHWLDGLKRLAEHPNVVVKISGLGTFIHENSETHIADVVGQALELFGVQRCVFGSNFPIEKLWTDYDALIGAYRRTLSHLSAQEQKAIFYDNASRIYRLGLS